MNQYVKAGNGNGAAVAVGAAGIGVIAGLLIASTRKSIVQGMEAAAGDWFDVLKLEHRMVSALFEKLSQTTNADGPQRLILFKKIKAGLSKHAFQEENVVYPALRKADPGGAAQHLNEDHFEIKSLLSEAEQADKSSEEFMAAMNRLQAIVETHVREEEDTIFPAFKAKLSEDANAKLTAMLHKEGRKLA